MSDVQTFEQWRETQPWYVVSKPDADEEWNSDAACTHRLMNIAAHESWTAGCGQSAEMLRIAAMELEHAASWIGEDCTVGAQCASVAEKIHALLGLRPPLADSRSNEP